MLLPFPGFKIFPFEEGNESSGCILKSSHFSLLAPHPKHATHWHGVLCMKQNQRTGTLIVCVPAEQTVHLAGGWQWGGDPPSETAVPGSLVAVGLISAALTVGVGGGQRLKVELLTWPSSACSQQPGRSPPGFPGLCRGPQKSRRCLREDTYDDSLLLMRGPPS